MLAVVLPFPGAVEKKAKAHPRGLLGYVCPGDLTLMATKGVGKALRFGLLRESRNHFRRSHRGRRNPELEEWRVKVSGAVEL